MSISLSCELFGCSRQVYYRSKTKRAKSRLRALEVIGLVLKIRRRMPRLGCRKLYYLLHEPLQNLGVGRDKLFSIMRANHLLIKPKRQYHITTNSHHRFRKHKNMTENLIVKRPEELWVSDITYIGERDCPKYLALVTDAYSKKIVGHDVSDSLSVHGSSRALEMALGSREYKDKVLIHHSDRGLQYCSDDYQERLSSRGIKCSMTEKYDPYQNAIAERVNGILKQEFLLGIKIQDMKVMSQLVKQSIQVYNNERPHLSCYMHTPNYMHQQSDIKIKTYKREKSRELQLSTL